MRCRVCRKPCGPFLPMGTVQSDWQPGFGEDPTIERAQCVRESRLPNHLPQGLGGRQEPPARDLELWQPRFEKDFGPPQRTDENQSLLGPADTRSPTEPERSIA